MPQINSIYIPIPPLSVADGGTDNTSELLNGQLWVGNTGTVPSISTLTAGANINVTNGPGSITIDSSATQMTWQNSTGQPLEAFNGYFAGPFAMFSLPTTPQAVGNMYAISGVSTGGFFLSIGLANQIILYNNAPYTSISTTSGNDFLTITLVCSQPIFSPKQVYTIYSTNGLSFNIS